MPFAVYRCAGRPLWWCVRDFFCVCYVFACTTLGFAFLCLTRFMVFFFFGYFCALGVSSL